jgi:2-haloacid dehalogenase
MTLYLSLNVYPDVIDALEQLKGGGMRLAILSNGTPQMLASAAANSGIADLLDAVLSVEEVGVFKPHPSVYKLASDRLQLAPDRICFLSSNGWDAYAAKAFGFHAVWCNRFNQSPERIPETPDGQIATLAALPAIVLS